MARSASLSENGSAPSSPAPSVSKQTTEKTRENTVNNNHVISDKLILPPAEEIPHYNPAHSDVTSVSSIPSSIPSSGGEVYGSNGDFNSSSTSDLPASSSSDYNIGPASDSGAKPGVSKILNTVLLILYYSTTCYL